MRSRLLDAKCKLARNSRLLHAGRGCDIINPLKLKQKSQNSMPKPKIVTKFTFKSLIMGTFLILAIGWSGIAVASHLSDDIQNLQEENAQNQTISDQLEAQANNYQDVINNLQVQINALQQAIIANQQASAQLEQEIKAKEAELAYQRDVLGQSIKAMYLEGQISTLEVLAASRNISDFVNKQVARSAVQNKIKTLVDQITQLKIELEQKQRELQARIKDQQNQQADLDAARAEQARLLAYTEGQKAVYDGQIKSNNVRIADLRRQQALENARLFGFSPGQGANCGGGYPGSANGPNGKWGCNYPIDYNIDNWGMYNRECVSYTAFKVAASGRYMPYWGGRGNANRWDDNARAAGIPVDTNPRVGDVAISNNGYYGHSMYVEAVGDDGAIYISDYNQQWDGKYREYWISGSTVRARGLVFIHFP